MNQCDGCRASMPLRGDMHTDQAGHAVMTCQALRYVPPDPRAVTRPDRIEHLDRKTWMDPKLIAARAEIQAVLEKHDIAGHVVLANTPGQLEIWMHLTPSWSNITVNGGEVRFRSVRAEYGGDKDKMIRDRVSTLGMVRSFGEVLINHGMAFGHLADEFDELTGAEHTPLERTEGKPQ